MLVLHPVPALVSEPVSARLQTPQRVPVWQQPTGRQVLVLDQGLAPVSELVLAQQQSRQRVSLVLPEPVSELQPRPALKQLPEPVTVR